jgi:hypothetical protein
VFCFACLALGKYTLMFYQPNFIGGRFVSGIGKIMHRL